jgi:glutamate synthase (NADPH/NADH) small chain
MWMRLPSVDELKKAAKSTTKRPMPSQDPQLRVKNFREVALGYTEEDALLEASRCLNCKKEYCREGCPVEIDIPAFIKRIKEQDYLGAARTIKEKSSLPAICGRVCPQESQCEKYCVRGQKGEPVAIGRLERFVADYELAHGSSAAGSLEKPVSNGHRVAVVGSGPAGLTVAGDLARKGYAVTIFEALHVAGGVLMYGIPEFRLPKTIVQREIEGIRQLGVDIQTNVVVGRTITVEQLLSEGYEAVFVGTGAGLPYFMGIPGENLNGVYSANEFLTRVNLMKGYLFPQYLTPVKVGRRVAVLGAGNVAMDAARTALRLGAEEVYIVYRRSEAEMPARHEEIECAKEEGVQFRLLTNPVAINGDQEGWVKKLVCLRYELGEPDESGRRSPIAIPGSEHSLEVETVVVAIGQGPNPLVASTTEGLAVNKRGNIVADENGQTSRPRVFAGGDIVTGAATVILAMGAGKKAAVAIDRALREGRGEY